MIISDRGGYQIPPPWEIGLSSITFGGPERKSWTGREDGRKKNENTIFKGPKFAAQKHLFLDFFENFQSRRF